MAKYLITNLGQSPIVVNGILSLNPNAPQTIGGPLGMVPNVMARTPLVLPVPEPGLPPIGVIVDQPLGVHPQLLELYRLGMIDIQELAPTTPVPAPVFAMAHPQAPAPQAAAPQVVPPEPPQIPQIQLPQIQPAQTTTALQQQNLCVDAKLVKAIHAMQAAADQLRRGEWNSHISGTWAILNDALLELGSGTPGDTDAAVNYVSNRPKSKSKAKSKTKKANTAIAQKQSGRSVISMGDGKTQNGKMVSSLADASVKNLPKGHPAHKAFEEPAPEKPEADKVAEAAFIDNDPKKSEFSPAFIDITTGEKLS